jgi:hypothetical protein
MMMAPDAVAFLGLVMEGAKTTNFAGRYFPVMENVIADAPQTIPKLAHLSEPPRNDPHGTQRVLTPKKQPREHASPFRAIECCEEGMGCGVTLRSLVSHNRSASENPELCISHSKSLALLGVVLFLGNRLGATNERGAERWWKGRLTRIGS